MTISDLFLEIMSYSERLLNLNANLFPLNLKKGTEINSYISILESRIEKLESDYISSKKMLIEIKKMHEIFIPISIFKAKELSALELVVLYLKDYQNLSNSLIAKIISRSQKTVWTTYHNASNKFSGKLNLKSEYYFPASIISERNLSVLESLIYYLVKNYKIDDYKLSELLKRDISTVKTIMIRITTKFNLKLNGSKK